MEAKSAMSMVKEAKQRIENLTPAQVAKEIEAGDVVLVDLREAEERESQGAIPGAIHAPRGMLEFYADPSLPFHRPELDPARRVILHCGGGGRSALAADTLRQMGYERAAHMDGGFKQWRAEGRPVEPVKA